MSECSLQGPRALVAPALQDDSVLVPVLQVLQESAVVAPAFVQVETAMREQRAFSALLEQMELPQVLLPERALVPLPA